MSDVLITRDGPYDAPYSYELGAREAFEPTTVEGLVDGTGAGGSFKIVCVIRSPDGKVLARVPTSETFSPGDEVAVTFAPFLRGGAALPTVIVANSFVSQARTAAQTITSAVVTALAPDIFTQAAGWNPGLFVTAGLPSGTLTFASYGTAVITLAVTWPAAAYDRYIELTVANPSLAEETKSPRFRVSATPDGDQMTLTAILSGGPGPPATTITANLFQASGVNRAVTAMFYAQQINAHVAVF